MNKQSTITSNRAMQNGNIFKERNGMNSKNLEVIEEQSRYCESTIGTN